MNDLARKIQAFLFYRGEPVTLKEIVKTLTIEEEAAKQALADLSAILAPSGLVLVENASEYTLGTHPDFGPLIEDITKSELAKDLGKAGLETLSIVAYRGPISRREIDYIRGVNSGFILRNLLVRGLVQKTQSKEDERVTLYEPSLELLSFMGLKTITELPEYETVQKELKQSGEENNQDA